MDHLFACWTIDRTRGVVNIKMGGNEKNSHSRWWGEEESAFACYFEMG